MRIALIIFFTSLFLISCSTKKDIIYFQDIDSIKKNSFSYIDHKIKIDDILKIEIKTELDEVTNSVISKNNFSNINQVEAAKLSGYLVNSNGEITLPEIGILKVSDLTINELKDKIYKLLVSDGKIFNELFIDIKIINFHFTILGEVKNPGRYEYLENNLNVLEAIGMSGDLTINGIRDNIIVVRKNKNSNTSYSIDLTSADILNNSNFQIVSGDIIIVNPNTTRIKNAGIIGNSGTLLSLLSFILSSIILITNN